MMRRDFLTGAMVTGLAARIFPGAALAQDGVPFTRSVVLERARKLAAEPFATPGPAVPDALANLGYSDYEGIRFREDRRLFADPPRGMTADLMHSGFIFKIPVEIFMVENGMARHVQYSPDMFTFQHSEPPAPDTPLEFAGFKLRTELNAPGVMDEFAVFAGASYFRAVAKGQIYGLSARGLAIGTGDEEGEEFPFFRAHWLEAPNDGRIVIHSLLDGPSATGAFRFTIRPGETTGMDVEVSLFARREITQVGVAPLTSMFLYSMLNRSGFDDFRPQVHDSDGLAIWNGAGERLWRPLGLPRLLQVSTFNDDGMRGFGLIQRSRRFSDYEDLQALYHRRPSLWVEPVGDWGGGNVVLVEIPSNEEIHDNIAAFWRPHAPIPAGGETALTYRLTWGWDAPGLDTIHKVVRSMSGAGGSGRRRFVVDFMPPPSGQVPIEQVQAVVSSSTGTLTPATLVQNFELGGLRVAFELDPAGADLVELRLQLVRDQTPISEVWLFRWTS